MIARAALIAAPVAAALAGVAALAQSQAPPAGPSPQAATSTASRTPEGAWASFNGQPNGQKYSPAAQITPDNVDELEVAWELHTGDVSDGEGDLPSTVWSATPLFVNDTVYVGTPFYRIFAVTPDTGEVKWIYDSKAELKAVTQPSLKNRGLAYWQAAEPVAGAACQKRLYLGTMMGELHAVDADTGRPCAEFGVNGVLDVNQWNAPDAKWPLSQLQPPTVYRDTLILGWAGKDWESQETPPGSVFGVDARTGERKWTFHTLPPEVAATSGTANVWTAMSVDEEAGLVYLPVSSPSPNFYGGNRLERAPHATSITALDAETGEEVWAYQMVHHDIWDYDGTSAPTLVDIRRGGETIPALIEATKQGHFFVLNRLTGEPIYPIEERPVPASDVPGERAYPTQPYVPRPEPVIADRWPGVSRLADILSLGYCSRKAEALRHDGLFTPPSLGEGSLVFPGTPGGVEWGGGALDPRTNTYVVNSSHVAMIYRLLTREDYERETSGQEKLTGYHPQTGSPYGLRLTNFLNPLGMPCWKPPYGSISAYDMDTGELLWRKPFGVVQKWGFYMPKSWGSVTIGGPAVTASGLIFIGASMDARVRALDIRNGEVLWKAQVDAPAVANPAVYTYRGRQYVAFVVGGNSILKPEVSDQLIAFALPAEGPDAGG